MQPLSPVTRIETQTGIELDEQFGHATLASTGLRKAYSVFSRRRRNKRFDEDSFLLGQAERGVSCVPPTIV